MEKVRIEPSNSPYLLSAQRLPYLHAPIFNHRFRIAKGATQIGSMRSLQLIGLDEFVTLLDRQEGKGAWNRSVLSRCPMRFLA